MSSKPSKRTTNAYKWLAHIQVYFNDEEIIEAQKWLDGKEEDLALSIDCVTSKDTSVKVTLDQHRSAYQITLQPKAKSSPYRGYTLGFTHVDLGRGMAIVEYIHEVLMDAGSIDIPITTKTNTW